RVVQRVREILEVVGAAAARGLRLRRGRGAPRARVAVEVSAAATTARAQHDQLAHVDLRAVARLPFLVLPLTVLDSPFDVELVALLDVALDDVGELRTLRVPDDTAVPLGLLLLRAGGVVPLTARGEREGRDAAAAGGRAHLRVVPEVSNQGD